MRGKRGKPNIPFVLMPTDVDRNVVIVVYKGYQRETLLKNLGWHKSSLEAKFAGTPVYISLVEKITDTHKKISQKGKNL